jgi:hypothetical protein
MTLSKQQATLYEAVSNIDSKYIEETVTAPIRFTPGAVKRVAAVAALLTLIIGIGFFVPMENAKNRSPYLTIQANALSTETSQRISIDYELVPETPWQAIEPYRPPSEWGDQKLFHFGVYINNIPRSYRTIRMDIEILYHDTVVDYYSNDSNFDIIPTLGGSEERHLTNMVYGWLPEDTLLTINMYVHKNTGRILLQSQTVLITVNGGYVLEILAAEINEDIEWSELS